MLGASAATAVALVLLISGSVAASGSGYNLSYSTTPTVTNTNVGLTSVSSSYTSGPNLTVSFTVAGTVILNSGDYFYYAYFGGTAESNATAFAFFTNNTTAGYYDSVSADSFGVMFFTLSNGGSTLSFSIATAAVGPSSSFAVDVFAVYGTVTAGQYSWLGTHYSGSGSCGASGCVTTPTSTSSGLGGIVLYAIIGVVVAVVIIALVVVLVMRGRRGPSAAPPPMAPGAMPPPPPGTGSPPTPPPPPPQGSA